MSWEDYALCREMDPELWFPDEVGGKWQARDAKRICERCPVKRQCLAATPVSDRYSVRGGLSPKQRAKLRREAA